MHLRMVFSHKARKNLNKSTLILKTKDISMTEIYLANKNPLKMFICTKPFF